MAAETVCQCDNWDDNYVMQYYALPPPHPLCGVGGEILTFIDTIHLYIFSKNLELVSKM